jgi:hypothetical protein
MLDTIHFIMNILGCDITLLLDSNQSLIRIWCLRLQSRSPIFYYEDGSGRFLQNAGTYAQNIRRKIANNHNLNIHRHENHKFIYCKQFNNKTFSLRVTDMGNTVL